MTARERFNKVLNFENPGDRLPLTEWHPWWDQTINRFKNEGMPKELNWEQTQEYFGIDIIYNLAANPREGLPPPKSHGAGYIDEETYETLRPQLMTDGAIENMLKQAGQLKSRHDNGDIIIRLWLDGYFWFPRTILGIERHLYAFYDEAELMRRINSDLVEYNIRTANELYKILEPDFIAVAEDMSYNHGPMLSYALYKDFILPYYKKTIPSIKKKNVKIFIDSDGEVKEMIPWLLEAGIEGVCPLERQAGVDINLLRKKYPKFLLMGGYDKMVMSLGETAMREEFERILPVMKSGGYTPCTDHHVPPGVSLENYRIYIKLFEQYSRKAVK